VSLVAVLLVFDTFLSVVVLLLLWLSFGFMFRPAVFHNSSFIAVSPSSSVGLLCRGYCPMSYVFRKVRALTRSGSTGSCRRTGSLVHRGAPPRLSRQAPGPSGPRPPASISISSCFGRPDDLLS
jgi:hypothetical protein